MLKALDCDSIGSLDSGMARLVINSAIREAIQDLEDRGAQDGKPRKVNISITFDLLDNGQVAASVEAFAKAPARKTATTFGSLRTDGKEFKLIYSENSPQDPTQLTINDLHEGKDE